MDHGGELGGASGDVAALFFEGAAEEFGSVEVFRADEAVNDEHELFRNPGADELAFGAAVGASFCGANSYHGVSIN